MNDTLFVRLLSRKILRKSIYLLVKIINNLIPKKQGQIVFSSSPDFSDNANAFFYYLKEKKPEYKHIWLVEKKDILINLIDKNIESYLFFSIQGFFKFIRSKYLIVTHNHYAGIKARNQVLINLWHGMPIKSIGFIDKGERVEDLHDIRNSFNKDDVFISTSALMRTILAGCLLLNPKKIYVTGQPRNDKLYSTDGKANLKKILDINVDKYKKIIFYCPTYRIGTNKEDGLVRNNNNIFNFVDYDHQKMQEFLNKKNILLLIKLHPEEEKNCSTKYSDYDNRNIKIIKSEMLSSNLLDVYDILGAMDVLITDYSSIFFDFLLLDKPLIFVPTDLGEYSKTRGFVLEPYDFWTPGPKVFNFRDFLTELEISIGNPNNYEKERKIINDLINQFQDGKSCERVWKILYEFMNK